MSFNVYSSPSYQPPAYAPPETPQIFGQNARNLRNEKSFFDNWNNEAPVSCSFGDSAARMLALPFTIVSGVLWVLSFTWGLILAFGPVDIVVNGVPTIVDESEHVGPALLWLAGFFALNLIMGIVLAVIAFRRRPKKPRPYAYLFLISVIALTIALSHFVMRIGLATKQRMVFSCLVGAGCGIFGLISVAYTFVLARGI